MRLAYDVTCWACGGDVTLANPGHTAGTVAKAVLGCNDCDAEWLATTLLRPLRDLARPGRTRRAGPQVADLAHQAHGLVAAGSSITGACRAVGVDRHTYYRYRRTA